MVLYYTAPTKKTASKQLITVTVDRLDGFGRGVANFKGKTIFINNALPQEHVTIKIAQDKKNYAIANVANYLITSPFRVIPKCHHYGRCGGCDMQHIPLELQRTTKISSLAHQLKTETGISFPLDDISVIAADYYGYRRRARLSIIVDKQQLVIGFRERESENIVDIDECLVLVPELQSLLLPLKSTLQAIHDKRSLGHIELVSVESGVIVILRHIKPLNDSDHHYLLHFAHEHGVSFYLLGKSLVNLTTQQKHYYQVGALQLSFSPLGFIQINREVNVKMIEQAMSWLDLTADDDVLDLFCGMGNFSLPMAQVSKRVIGVEGVPALVEQAKLNAQTNHEILASEPQFYVQNLDDWHVKPNWWPDKVNKVLLDPARAGAFAAVKQIVELSPTRIVYISCNPATLARDSAVLTNAGYHIRAIAILDMFPQTKHVESMMLFTKME